MGCLITSGHSVILERALCAWCWLRSAGAGARSAMLCLGVRGSSLALLKSEVSSSAADRTLRPAWILVDLEEEWQLGWVVLCLSSD